MEIDSHILGLSMEFEKQNMIITEWETERAKSKSDQIYAKRKKKRMKKKQPKIYLEPTDDDYESPDDEEATYDNESGFEVIILVTILTTSTEKHLHTTVDHCAYHSCHLHQSVTHQSIYI